MSEAVSGNDNSEIERLKTAARVAETGMDAALRHIKPGMTESEVAAEAEYAMRKAGAVDFYRSYVASGPRTNVAHEVGIEFDESPLPAGHAFFHGEKEPPPLDAGVVIAIGNCGLYTGSWGMREEDTVLVGAGGPVVLINFPRKLEI